jgi:hypothetical protein
MSNGMILMPAAQARDHRTKTRVATMELNIAPPGAKAGMRPVDERAVSLMKREIAGQTDEVLMRQFGISYNTWRKVREGQPIRRSVADRLEQRMAAFC